MKASELVVLGVVVFIALVVADLWMEQQRYLILQEMNVRLATPKKIPTIIGGFAGVA